MKIHQLPMGARFTYEGEAYVKTGPLLAAGKGGQRLIPKYAVLAVADTVPPAPAMPPSAVSREAVLAAFDAFSARCAALVPPDGQADLAAAREDFLRALVP